MSKLSLFYQTTTGIASRLSALVVGIATLERYTLQLLAVFIRLYLLLSKGRLSDSINAEPHGQNPWPEGITWLGRKGGTKFLLLTLFLLLCYLLLSPFPSFAQALLESDHYRLEFSPYFAPMAKPDLSLPPSTERNSKQQQPPKTKDKTELPVRQFTDKGFILKTGFPKVTSTAPFTFSLSPLNIDLTNLLPATEVKKSATITIEPGSATGYQLFTQAETSLTNRRGDIIPPTACDSPFYPCTLNRAASWKRNDRFGMGFSLWGDDQVFDFGNNLFRPFPQKDKSQPTSLIMTQLKTKSQRQTTVSFKIVISPEQPGGFYSNKIYFIALPRY